MLSVSDLQFTIDSSNKHGRDIRRDPKEDDEVESKIRWSKLVRRMCIHNETSWVIE